MKAEYINPFLESARFVLEQVANVRPTTGQLTIKDIKLTDHYIWIQIGMTGHMQGEIVFGLAESAALKVVSAMMGGFVLDEMNEIGQSAISELSNMISGNASTLLYNQGVKVDITPPVLIVSEHSHSFHGKQALTVPLIMDGIGELDIQVLIS
ncbi:chemotaxis protein CheX [Paenibacillus sp. N1-5-1-14]|uniref:chemotaxis protein CheX n=1 Tax=Paenibacillus radicibacter TaxID=2972488 RepID=UPI0021593913|nr:chemotaxis protein CheX [Paenibacillus radicibacter]MCR8645229.1 chemotaxis protein CheX [Paenibacillus radicibacter]